MSAIAIDRLKAKLRTFKNNVSAIYCRVSAIKPIFPILCGLLFLTTFLLAWTVVHPKLGNSFTQDSFAYYMLGTNLFDGLGYVSDSARDFSVEPVWPVPSKSFPPLHPILIGITELITDMDIQSGCIVSLIYIIGTILAVFFLGREMDRRTWLFVFFSYVVLLMTNKPYAGELQGARSIPGMTMFFLLALLFFLKIFSGDKTDRRRSRRFEILSGLMLAAMLHQRFDQTLFCLAFMFLSFFIFKLTGYSTRESAIKTGTIAGAFFIASLPWGIRNTIQFGAPFASDNTGSTTTTFRGLYCCSFWLPGQEPPTLFTRPELWFNQRLGFLERNFDRIVNVTAHLVYVTPIAILAMWKTFNLHQRIYVSLAVVHFCTTLFTISMTPYGDARYFSLVHLNILIVLAISTANIFTINAVRVVSVAVQIAMVLYIGQSTFSTKRLELLTRDLLAGKIVPQNTDSIQKRFKSMDERVSKYLKKGDILSVKPNAEGYAYFTGRYTVYYPSTVGRNRKVLAEWSKAWHADFYLIPKRDILKLRLQKYVVETIDGRPLVDAGAFLKDFEKN